MLWQLGELKGGSEGADHRHRAPRSFLVTPGRSRRPATCGVIVTNTNLSSGPGGFHRARALAEPLGNAGLLSEILHNIGFVHEALGEHERALDLFRESQRVAAKGGESPAAAAVTTDTIGMVLYDLGRYRDAELQFRRALAVHRQTGDRRQQAISLTHLGWVYADTGDSPRPSAPSGRPSSC